MMSATDAMAVLTTPHTDTTGAVWAMTPNGLAITRNDEPQPLNAVRTWCGVTHDVALKARLEVWIAVVVGEINARASHQEILSAMRSIADA